MAVCSGLVGAIFPVRGLRCMAGHLLAFGIMYDIITAIRFSRAPGCVEFSHAGQHEQWLGVLITDNSLPASTPPPPTPWSLKRQKGIEWRRKCRGEDQGGLELQRYHSPSHSSLPHFLICSIPFFLFQLQATGRRTVEGVASMLQGQEGWHLVQYPRYQGILGHLL